MKDAHGFARQLFAGLPRRYDLLAELLSFGQNRRWRRAMVDHAVAGDPPLVLDVATGTAGVALQLVQRSPARVIGIDLPEPMLRYGVAKVDRAHLDDRIDMVVGSAVQLPFADGSFDALTFTYLLRYVDDAGATLRELARAVKPGGYIASLEFFVPRIDSGAGGRSTRGWCCRSPAASPVGRGGASVVSSGPASRTIIGASRCRPRSTRGIARGSMTSASA